MSVSPFIVKYEKTLARDPRSRVFAPLSGLYRKVGLIDKAKEVLQNGIRYNPDYIPGYIELANYYIDLKEYQLAHATLRPLMGANRDNLKLLKVFVSCCLELDYRQEALDGLKYLLFLNPKDSETADKITELEKNENVFVGVETSKEIKFDIDSLETESVEDTDYGDWVEVKMTHDVPENDENDSEWSIENHQSELQMPPSQSLQQESTNSPRLNYALVDLYLEQGHIEKAKEVMIKILELQPDDQQAQLKLDEINTILGESASQLPSHDADYNTGNLMDVFDRKIAQPQQKDREQVEQKLDEFLDALRSRRPQETHP